MIMTNAMPEREIRERGSNARSNMIKTFLLATLSWLCVRLI
jgi:hypothetical protein